MDWVVSNFCLGNVCSLTFSSCEWQFRNSNDRKDSIWNWTRYNDIWNLCSRGASFVKKMFLSLLNHKRYKRFYLTMELSNVLCKYLTKPLALNEKAWLSTAVREAVLSFTFLRGLPPFCNKKQLLSESAPYIKNIWPLIFQKCQVAKLLFKEIPLIAILLQFFWRILWGTAREQTEWSLINSSKHAYPLTMQHALRQHV